MIYTSYFANLNKLPDYIIPISICAKAPSWYSGLEYKKLTPTYSILMEYKNSHNEELYIKRFTEEVLNKQLPMQVVLELAKLAGTSKGFSNYTEFCLICYEKPADFCHRHLVAKWLSDNFYPIREWSNK